MTRSRLAVPLAVTAATLLGAGVYAALAWYAPAWSDLQPATCMPDACFCEAIRSGSIRQPANTASGLVFLPVAAGLAALSNRRRRAAPASGQPLLLQSPVHTWIFVAAIALTGLGTAFYHASLSFVLQTVDVLGMYLVATFLVLYAIARLRDLPPLAAATAYVLGNGVLLWGLVAWPEARRYTFAGLIALVLLLEYAVGRRRHFTRDARYFGAAVAVLLAGMVLWFLDLTRTVCAPHSLLQGHALWHIAGAGSLALLFRYHVSETPRQMRRGTASKLRDHSTSCEVGPGGRP
jgi:hypothetical protein